jgi:hypothetical protein
VTTERLHVPGTTTEAPSEARRDVPAWGPRAPRILGVVAVICLLGWGIPAVVMANKGFSVQDEGTYVLSYRFWNTNPYFISGSQYFYGPLFAAMHGQIAGLRMLRLFMAIATNVWFARAFLGWLAHHRGVRTFGLGQGGVALLAAAGGMTYLWTPLTPSYYDLTADASLALVALMFSTLGRASRPPAWMGILAGCVSFVLVLTKWPALLVVLLVQGVLLADLSRHSRAAAVRYATCVAAGLAATALACQLFLFRLNVVLPALHAVSVLTATATHSPEALARSYVASTTMFATASIAFAIPLIGAYVMALRASQRGRESSARWCIVAGALVTGLVVPLSSGWHGGGERGRVMVAVTMAALLSSLVAAGVPRTSRATSRRRTERVAESRVLGVLVAVPVLQALGTDVPLIYVSSECLALWVAIVLIMVSRSSRPPVSLFAVETSLIVCVVSVALLAGTTTLMSPFKATGLSSDTVAVPSLGGLRLAPETASEYSALEDAVAPYVQRGVTPVLTLDRLAGVTYLVGGVPMGSTWTDASSPGRTAGILELACRNGDVDRARTPVLIVDRAPGFAVRDALRRCGFDYPSDFRGFAVAGGPPGLQVFVPLVQKR